MQTGYLVLRLSLANGLTGLPSTGPLPSSATSFSDTSLLPDPVYCYAVFPLGASGPIGQSDLHCLITNTAGGSSVASHFSIQLNQSQTATLRWTPASGATGQALLAIPLNGAPARVTTLSPGQSSVTDNTFGVATCYGLFTLNATGIAGNTTTICGIPGFSSFPAPSIAK
jgi:hypothetical protein